MGSLGSQGRKIVTLRSEERHKEHDDHGDQRIDSHREEQFQQAEHDLPHAGEAISRDQAYFADDFGSVVSVHLCISPENVAAVAIQTST